MISTEKSTVGLCDQTIPPPDFFLQKIPFYPLGTSTGVADFSAAPETVSAFTASTPQTMHNSNLFDNIACPEAATIIISILSALMRVVSGGLIGLTIGLATIIILIFVCVRFRLLPRSHRPPSICRSSCYSSSLTYTNPISVFRQYVSLPSSSQVSSTY